jgi:predicted CoA-binding protein
MSASAKRVTLVIGASENPDRYSYKAIHRLRQHGHSVAAIGVREGQVADVPIAKIMPDDSLAIDTVTLYIGPALQPKYRDMLLARKPRRVIFNPGTENPALAEELEAAGIEPVEACTLVMLSTSQYD